MSELPLSDLKVVDCATLFAGPLVATLLGDYGADVVKIEHPRGDHLRSMGWSKSGVPLWWSFVSRNKRCITLLLSSPRGQELFRELIRDTDVLIENFRPGTLERWNLSPTSLMEINSSLIVVRTTGFGQTGPYARRPGFGTLAEAISGFAHINGWPDKPPALPPIALGDGVAALTGTFAVMFALWWREHGGGGRGQVIDLSIYEPLFWLLGSQATEYDQLGIVQDRLGNRSPDAAPRNAYRSSDGQWLALSASAQSIAERVVRLIDREDLVNQPWFATHAGRLEHIDELDAAIQDWIGKRTAIDVLDAFSIAEAAIAPIYSIKDIFNDPQYQARETIAAVPHPELGMIAMPGIIPRLSETPGRINSAGPALGEHNYDVLVGVLGLDEAELTELQSQGVIAAAPPRQAIRRGSTSE